MALTLPSWLPRWSRGIVIPALRLSGVIGSVPFRGAGLTLTALEASIDALFADKRAPAVALVINSPGGSPVQSSLIAQRIRSLSEEKKKPVLGFVEDVAASGGYWLACAADEVYADPASILGSIGVVSSGFGFQEAIARLGIERRMHTAGSRKSLLDPFQPERPEDVEMLERLQQEIHARFIHWVESRRSTRLKPGDEPLFDGRIWTGERAVSLGLIDGLAEPRTLLRARFGEKTRLRFVNPRRGWLARRLRAEASPGLLVEATLAAIEERALWQRFGL